MKRLLGRDVPSWVLALVALGLTLYYVIVCLAPASVAVITDAAGRYH